MTSFETSLSLWPARQMNAIARRQNMGVITIELADGIEHNCSCCGGRLIRLTRFVYADGDAHAVYYADFSPNHAEHSVRVALSLGGWGGWEWDGGRVPKKRVAFALRIRANEAEYQTT